MQVLRTTTAAPIVEPPYGVPRAAPSEVQSPETATTERRTAPPADLPALSGSDRAAVASATGFYLSPTGEVTPDGMPPWSFIMQYLQRRHAEAPAQPATAQGGGVPADDGRRVDLQV